MSDKLQKLELTWPGKEDRFHPEPRILLEDTAKSYSKPAVKTDLLGQGVEPTFDNMLIHGDNLLALKALEQDFTGKIKCIYIDPPYNTGSVFEHYDDGLEHSLWLSLMRDRLEILKRLLSEDGSIWINLDDNEVHYCKVLCDEIFGRQNFLCDVAWEKRYSPPPDTKDFGYIHDHILVYRKSVTFNRNLLPLTEDQKSRYKNQDNDPRGCWKAMDYTCRYSAQQRPNLYYPIIQPNTGEEIWPKETRVWASSKEVTEKNIRENRLWWGKDGKNRVPALKNFISDIQQGMMPMSLWRYDFAGTNQDAKKESMALFGKNPFATPKPEKLINLILSIASNPGDIILDSFLGSGTTAAVAQKMGRRWIGVEMGEHINTHCIPRLQKVINGEDQGGITKTVNWHGGGGFKFYELAASLIVKDKYGQQIISDKYNAEMLAEAMCKILGYHYKPDPEKYWKQGFSSEKSFIYTTTMSMQEEALSKLADDVGEDNLLICCSAFIGNPKAYPNISVKKIPAAILKKCEWGMEGYPLNISAYHPTDEDFEFEEEA